MKHLLVICLVLVACGKEPAPKPVPPPPIDPDVPEAKALISVWGAPWCGPCKQSIPKIQAELNASGRKDIGFVLHVVSGNNPGSKCTEEIALAYAEHYAPGAKALCDQNGKLAKGYGLGSSIPSAAVFKNEELVQKFKAGADFIAAEVVKAALAL